MSDPELDREQHSQDEIHNLESERNISDHGEDSPTLKEKLEVWKQEREEEQNEDENMVSSVKLKGKLDP